MYAYINGILTESDNQYVVVEANGIGYQIYVPGSVLNNLPSKGDRVKLFTYLHLREDCQELYGFLNKDEKQFFEKLISVSGVGPKAALAMLSAFSAGQLAMAIITGDSKSLCSVPGIGKKTAERVILELKDKIDNDIIRPQESMTIASRRWNTEQMEALQALQALGYPASEAERALAGLEGKDASALIRQALKNLDNSGR
ncbi:MAG TPA: Holliday junction branch migration protein RuvA [Clostridiales bacterium]|nr:Holliday junction branch migration protein RuvA [Clostridiales bacterium]